MCGANFFETRLRNFQKYPKQVLGSEIGMGE